jgi:hypothetical protein
MACAVMGWMIWVLGFATGAKDLEYRPARIANPLKGVIAESVRLHETFPHSLRYVLISVAAVMNGEREFDWSALEKRIEVASDVGKQVVVRPYLDWPGWQTGTPVFLIEAGLKTNALPRWRERQQSSHLEINPDYDDPKLRNAIRSFIAAFGERYDGKPEIAFVEAGLLGPWGEWLPSKESPLSAEVKMETLNAYQKAFRKTKVLARFPSAESDRGGFGFHNDWFTGESQDEVRLAAGGAVIDESSWMRSPRGARIFPELQSKLWRSDPRATLGSNFVSAVKAEHLSYLRLGTAFFNVESSRSADVIKAVAQDLGYELFVSSAEVMKSPEGLEISVTITNTGSAPFYYAWSMELAIAKGSEIVFSAGTNWDITKAIPGEKAIRFNQIIDGRNIREGQYDVLLRISNPLVSGPSVAFANREQDATIHGWLTLGSIGGRSGF